MLMSNTKLVFSTDPKEQKCPRCKEFLKECTCAQSQSDIAHQSDKVEGRNFVAVFRLEKAHRGGKTVTVIDQLPKLEVFLKDLTKEIKTKCGVGGTYSVSGKEGKIEIQGDQRERVKALFDKKGIRYKGM